MILLLSTIEFSIIMGFLIFLGIVALAIRTLGTYDDKKLSKEQLLEQKSFSIALIIAMALVPLWLIPISIFTTQTDYSTIDPILIERGVIPDNSHLLYFPSWQVSLFFIISGLLEIFIIKKILKKAWQ
jgi:hypothetical protein